MQITRHNHLRYMAKLAPLLVALYLLQVFLYQKFAPAHMGSDISLFLGVGLAAIIFCYLFYDQHHRIVFHGNYLEVTFDLLKMNEEILYRKIKHIEIKKRKQYYGNIILHLEDGTSCSLYHIDSPDFVAQYIEKKRNKN